MMENLTSSFSDKIYLEKTFGLYGIVKLYHLNVEMM